MSQWFLRLLTSVLNLFLRNKAHKRFCDGLMFQKHDFFPQDSIEFSKETALWCLTTIQNSYLISCGYSPKENKQIAIKRYSPLRTNLNNLSIHLKGFLAKVKWLQRFTKSTFEVGQFALLDSLSLGEKKRILISIAGTDNLPDVIEDIDAYQTPLFKNDPESPMIHHGFYDFTLGSPDGKPSLFQQIETMLDETIDTDIETDIYITGHSLGAAAATIIATLLGQKYAKEKKINLITYNFGSPRVGNPKFAEIIKQVAMDYQGHFIFYRVFNAADIITQLPHPVSREGNYVYDHNDIFFGHEVENAKSVVGDLGFQINLGNYDLNQQPKLYMKGLENHPTLLSREN